MRIHIATVGAAVILLLAGCGGGGGSKTVSLDDFVNGACGDFSDMTDQINEAIAPLSDLDLEAASDPGQLSQVKDTLLKYVDDSLAAVNSVKNKLADEGQPDVSNGAEFSSKFQQGFDALIAGLNDAKQKIKDFDPETGSSSDLESIFSDFGNAVAEQSDLLTDFTDVTNALSDQCSDAFS